MAPTSGQVTVLGLDVSAAQGASLDWGLVPGAGYAFAFCKATEGAHYEDPAFLRNWRSIAAAGLIRGAYHFAHPAVAPEVQAEQLARALEAGGGLCDEDLPPVLDIEEARGIAAGAPFVDWILRWVRRVGEITGRRAIVYCGGPFFIEHAAHADAAAELASYPLWLAAYVRDPSRFIPPPWTRWMFWQRSGDVDASGASGARFPGTQLAVDVDVFAGSLADLRKLIADSKIDSAPTDPAPGPVAIPDGSSSMSLQIERQAEIAAEADLSTTIPETPTSKSAPRMQAVDAPIAGVVDQATIPTPRPTGDEKE